MKKRFIFLVFVISIGTLLFAQTFEPLYSVPAKDIEIGETGVLWSVAQTHVAYKLELATGNTIGTLPFNIPTGNDGRGVAWDGTSLWYSEWDFDKIYKIDIANGNILMEFNSPGFGPQGLAFGGGYLWHTDEYTDDIYKIDPVNGSVVGTLPSPEPSAWFVGIAYHNGNLWLASVVTGKLYNISATTGDVITTIQFPFGTMGDITCDNSYLYISSDQLYRLAINPSLFEPLYTIPAKDIEIGETGVLWSVAQTHVAYKLELATGNTIGTLPFNIPTGNDGRGVAWDGTSLWYSEWDFDKIYKIDIANGNILMEFNSPGFGPQGLAFGGGYLWHTDEYTDDIYKIDPVNGSVVGTLPSPEPSAWFVGIAYHNGNLWLASVVTGKLYNISATTGDVITTIQFPFGTMGDITCDNSYLYISSDQLYRLAINPSLFEPLYTIPAKDIEIGETGVLWSVAQTHVAYKLELATGNTIGTLPFNIPANDEGRGVAWDGTSLWYSEWDFDKIYKIDIANGNIQMEFNSPGFGPQGLAFGGGYIWHTDEYSDVIYKINPVDGTVVSTLPVPETVGWYVGIAYNNGTLWLSNYQTNNITQIDANTGNILFSINFPFDLTGDITCDNYNLYLVGQNTLYRLNFAVTSVELQSFTSEVINNGIQLNWITATETNNNGFVIKRNDLEIGFVNGTGTSTARNTYIFIDKNLKPGLYRYSLIHIDFDGSKNEIGRLIVELGKPPLEYNLVQNFPNPFNPTTTINYLIPRTSFITLKIYDALGREVTTLVNGEKPAGSYQDQFDASKLSSGIYFYRLQAGDFISTKKMTLLR